MPRTRSLAWSELKLGVLTITALIIAAITIFLVTGGRGFFWQRYTLKTKFPNVAGLKSGSPVRLAGVEIGSVLDTPFSGEQVDVIFEVNKSYRDRITTMSTTKLGSVSLLGEAAVDITPSSAGTPIPDGGYVPTGKAAAQLSDVTDQASAGIVELSGLIHDLREGHGTAGKLLTDDQLYLNVQQFVSTTNDLVKSIREGRGTLGKLVTDRKTADELDAILVNINRLTTDLNAGQGSMGKLLKDQAFADNLTGVTSSLKDLTDRLSRGEGTAGKFLTDQSLFNQLNSVTKRLDDLMTNLNAGQGTAGLLLKDKQLYENINGTVSDLRNLIAAIQKDPRKYLNVRISVF
jgi:phospholipid/cholesterol/gamma-HCH transport system substrate-binding protein